MTRPVVVRRAARSDADSLAQVRVSSWRGAYRHLLPDAVLDDMDLFGETERFRAWLEHPPIAGTFTWVAVESTGLVCGYLIGGPYRADQPSAIPGTGEVYALYVDPSAWRSGVGSALLDAAQEYLAAAGFCSAALWVLETNLAARSFYEARGWTPDGATAHCREALGVPEVRYERALPALPRPSG
jgi:ribosomal protein S18 acetylase RimI-like enzyme